MQDNYISAIIPYTKEETITYNEVIKFSDTNMCDASYHYLCWTFDMRNVSCVFTKQYIEDKTRSNIIKNVRGELYDNRVYSGVPAFNQFIKILETYKSNEFDDKKSLLEINEKISAKGGLYQTRFLYAGFLEWYNKNYDTDEWVIQYAKIFDEIAKEWKIISTIILKSVLKQRKVNWDEIIERSSKVIQEEEKYYEHILMLSEKSVKKEATYV